MLPIVDTNWSPPLKGEGSDFHTLRAVAVQPAMAHEQALHNLQALCQRAKTPGLGGLPHGVVVFIDLALPDVISHIDEMAAHDKVRGVHIVLGEELAESSKLVACLTRIAHHDLSIDISGDVETIKLFVATITTDLQVPVIINVSQASRAGKSIPLNEWATLVKELTDSSNVTNNIAIKLSDIPEDCAPEALGLLSASMREIVETVGEYRILFGSGNPASSSGSDQNVWSHFDHATLWSSASARDRWLRGNAISIYRV